MTSVLLLTLFMCGFGIGATVIQLNNDPQQLGSEQENNPQEDPDEGFGGPDGFLRPRTSNVQNIEPVNPGYDPDVSDILCEKCPAGWTYFEERCYIYKNTTMDWIGAEKHCLDIGGNLASAETSTEFLFIRYFIYQEAGSNTETWLGAHDTVADTHWLWSDGTQFNFDDWENGRPQTSAGNDKDCMQINTQGDNVRDEPCSNNNAFICEKHA